MQREEREASAREARELTQNLNLMPSVLCLSVLDATLCKVTRSVIEDLNVSSMAGMVRA